MTSTKAIYFAVSLILLSPISSTITTESIDEERAQSMSSPTTENNWVVLHNPSIGDHPISEASGLIHSPFGKFDPLTESPQQDRGKRLASPNTMMEGYSSYSRIAPTYRNWRTR